MFDFGFISGFNGHLILKIKNKLNNNSEIEIPKSEIKVNHG